jgi:hypothetical protein
MRAGEAIADQADAQRRGGGASQIKDGARPDDDKTKTAHTRYED